MFIQSVFNNPLSVTNDNNKIQDAKGTSNKSAEIKQTVKNESKNIGSGSDTVLSNVVIDNHAATIQANSDSNWDTVTDDSNSFFTEVIESEKTLEMEPDILEKLFSRKHRRRAANFFSPLSMNESILKKKFRSQPILLHCF